MLHEVELKIGNEIWIWRDNMLTRLTLAKMLKISNPLQVFAMLRERGPEPETVGALIVSGIKYQPDELGHFADTGITPIDVLANMSGDIEEFTAMVERIVDVINGVRPTQAGQILSPAEPMTTEEPNVQMSAS